MSFVRHAKPIWRSMANNTTIPGRVLATMKCVWPISDESTEKLISSITPCSFPKRYKLIKEGVSNGKAYFIEKGITRSFWIVDGEEITTSFSTEGGIVFSMDELYYGQTSEEYVESIEHLDCFAIDLHSLRQLVSENLDLANWGRIIHQNEYRRLHRSHKERLTLPARERYEAFASQFPDVCRRARLSDIASYLGITPSTLSRIRAGKL